MRIVPYTFVVLILCLASAQAAEKKIIGWVEPVQLLPGHIPLLAKIDTGADHSSLHAEQLEIYQKQNEERVRFTILDDGDRRHTMDKPVLRYASIKRRGVATQQRPVIQLDLCLGRQLQRVEINLTNRHNYEYRMLVGRSFLAGLFIVDAGEKQLSSPQCDSVNGDTSDD
jgi:hypothetical protein